MVSAFGLRSWSVGPQSVVWMPVEIFGLTKLPLANTVCSTLHATSDAVAWKGFSICLRLSISMSRAQAETRPSTIKTGRWWVLHHSEHEIWLITIMREPSIPRLSRAYRCIISGEGEEREKLLPPDIRVEPNICITVRQIRTGGGDAL